MFSIDKDQYFKKIFNEGVSAAESKIKDPAHKKEFNPYILLSSEWIEWNKGYKSITLK